MNIQSINLCRIYWNEVLVDLLLIACPLTACYRAGWLPIELLHKVRVPHRSIWILLHLQRWGKKRNEGLGIRPPHTTRWEQNSKREPVVWGLANTLLNVTHSKKTGQSFVKGTLIVCNAETSCEPPNALN